MPADERREIETAMERLLNGTPLRSDGKLTIVSLAAEAGVKRHVLTHKHTDLRDLFNARVKAQHSVPASETALREQNEELRRKLDDMSAERDEYKQAADALARALNVLTTENDELRRQASRARDFTGPRPLARLLPCGLLTEPGCGWLDICGGVERPSVLTFRYQAKPDVTPMTRSLQDQPNAAAGRWFSNTAELSGEVSKGDVVAVGEAGLAVGRVGWILISGGLNEVRTSEHGTRPLPSISPCKEPGT